MAEILVSIIQPSAGQVTDDNLVIAATVTSTFEFAAVTASVEGRGAELVFAATAISNRGIQFPGWTILCAAIDCAF